MSKQRLNKILQELSTTTHEKVFFQKSAEAFKLLAQIIQDSQFLQENLGHDIPYDDQVLEYSLEELQEYLQRFPAATIDC